MKSPAYERIATADGQRAFVCPQCPKTFQTVPPLKRHIEIHHAGGRPKPPSVICRLLLRH